MKCDFCSRRIRAHWKAGSIAIDAVALSRERDRLGPLLETFVLQELRRQASWHPDPIDFFHYRDRDGFEVDVVLERGSTSVAGVEVKAAASVNDADFRGLRKERTGDRRDVPALSSRQALRSCPINLNVWMAGNDGAAPSVPGSGLAAYHRRTPTVGSGLRLSAWRG